MTARLWTHRDHEPGSRWPHALMFGDDVKEEYSSEAEDPKHYAEFCAIEAQLAPFGDLPDGVELRPTATGAWLREHGEGWERLYGTGWRSDHFVAGLNAIYVVRRVPEPPAPETEKVPHYETLGRLLPDGRRIVGYTATTSGSYVFAEDGVSVHHVGLVEVLKD